MEYLICTTEDVPKIASLERACIECAWTQAMIEESMALGYIFVKAEQDGNFCGYGGVRVVFDEAEICNVAVHPQYRNQGVASGICMTILSFLRARGVSKAFLEVNEHNEAAIALYRKLGFEQIARREGYYESGSAIIMSLTF